MAAIPVCEHKQAVLIECLAGKMLSSKSKYVPHMAGIDLEKLLRSFTERRREADPKAQEVLDEFIRVAEDLPADSGAWDEVVALEQSWRDTLSDSQVIKYLRALHPDRALRKRGSQR